MNKDTYFRKGIKWAKISGQRGSWSVALGWRGEFKARRVQKTVTKLHAEVIARNYVNDQ